ncbi:MAG: cobamide remodeling phosphodiesterase CbiR [Candidatus Njordarchaeales archaeon]
MRLGIVPLYEISELRDIISTPSGIDFAKFDYSYFVEKGIKQGFRHFEITGDIYFFIPNSFNEDILKRLIDFSKKYDASFSVHLPIWSIELSSPNKKIREASISACIETINVFEDIKPVTYVVHPFGSLAAEFSRLRLEKGIKDIVLRFFQLFARESLEKIISETGIDPRRLAIETIEFPWELTFELVEAFNTTICFDTGHTLSGQPGDIDLMEFLSKYFNKISEIHLHDALPRKSPNDFTYIDHLPLGEGKLPFCKILEYLMVNSFQGPVVFELSYRDVEKSLEAIKSRCRIDLTSIGFEGII